MKTFEALRRLGWQGDYITWARIEAEAELARLKDGKFYIIGANSLFQDNLPIHKLIIEEAKKGSLRYRRATDRRLDQRPGARGRARRAGWPADAAKSAPRWRT